jgi:CRP-like cAMP-binding protein
MTFGAVAYRFIGRQVLQRPTRLALTRLLHCQRFEPKLSLGTSSFLPGRTFCRASKRPRCYARRKQSTSTTVKRENATLATAESAASNNERESFWKTVEDFWRKPRTIPIPRWISPRHHTMTVSEIFGHSSFLLVAISYAVDDFLMPRIIAVAGSTAMLVFTYFHPHGRVLWLPFKWNMLFIAINSYRIGKVYLERYWASQLSEEFLELRRKHFYLMDAEDFAKLVRLGKVEEYKPGDHIASQGVSNCYMRLVLEGDLDVLRDSELTYVLEKANFVAEAGLHAGLLLPGEMESCCTVVAKTKTRLLVWDRSELVELLARDAGILRALKATLTWDLVRKLKGQRLLLSTGRVNDPEAWTVRRNEQTQHRYAAILHNILLHPYYLKKERNELNKYRMIHHIDDEAHNKALREVGWTPEEFELGHRNGHGEDMVDGRRGWKWYIHEYFIRVFGH